MNKRATLTIVTVIVVAAAMWFGGAALWHVILAMHAQR
jgi:hypothetical protein